MKSRWEATLDGAVKLPVNETLGFKPGQTQDPREEISFTWKVPHEYCNSADNLQGGMLAAFADAVLGAATAAYLPEDEYPALAEMKISIFRPAPAGTLLVGDGYVLKRGKRVVFAEAEITDADGNLIAKASGTEIPAPA
jgi:uncharacterized protein (TIGR00369 family)